MRTAVGVVPVLVVGRRIGIEARHVWAGGLVTAATVEGSAPLAVAGALAAVALPAAEHRRRWSGLAAGGASTFATLAVFPRIRDAPARGVAVTESRDVVPSPEGAGLVVIVNPRSGSGGAPDVADELAQAFPAADIRPCAEGDDLEELLREAATHCRTLGIVGGDGSVNVAARIALEADVPLAVFPGGTLNHFARELGIDALDAAIAAVRDGHVVAIDVGTADDHVFLNNASIGSYAALVDERERMENRLGKWPAMMVALIRVLHRGERLEVVVDGERRRVWMVFFGNGSFDPPGFAPADRADLVDGLLDVRLVDASSPWSRLRVIAAVLLGALGRSRVYERTCTPRVTIVGDDGGLRLAIDGETVDVPGAIVVGKRPAALLVHAPHQSAERP